MRRQTGIWAAAAILFWSASSYAQQPSPAPFNGLDMTLGNLSRLSDAQTRSISAGELHRREGQGGDGHRRHRQGRRPRTGPGLEGLALGQHQGRDHLHHCRNRRVGRDPADLDDARRPSWTPACSFCASTGTARPSRRSSAPLGDFFACGWGKYCQINSLPVCVNPGSAFNCYWSMPFRKKAQDHPGEPGREGHDALLPDQLHADRGAGRRGLFPRPVPPRAQAAGQERLHDPRWRPRPGPVRRHLLAWEVHNPGWWGEGEIKFYLDGDREFPTICGTGTEDYFCGSYDFEDHGRPHRYQHVHHALQPAWPRCCRRS